VTTTFGPALNLNDTPPNGVITVPGCDPDDSGVERDTYENVGVVTIGGVVEEDPSHYCNPPMDLQIIKEIENEIVGNLIFDYSVTVQNIGGTDATGVVMLDLLPPRELPDPPYAGVWANFPAFDGVGDSTFEIEDSHAGRPVRYIRQRPGNVCVRRNGARTGL
jgi:hypothetical protein